MTDFEWLDERVEAYIDGDLTETDRMRFEAALADSSELRAAVAAAHRVRDGLGAIGAPKCPEHVVADVLAAAKSEPRGASIRERYLDALLPGFPRAGAFAIAAAVTIVVIAGVLILTRPESAPSEVEQGLADVKVALAYVGEAGRHTGNIVRVKVVDQRVVNPIRKAVVQATGEESDLRPTTTPNSQENKRDADNE
ncbi:MAG: zf-HC2 domain-containing protein [Rhodothermales bacterium]|nr:zf-HC2 domain-containing protein [Rhodothermales bacterium]